MESSTLLPWLAFGATLTGVGLTVWKMRKEDHEKIEGKIAAVAKAAAQRSDEVAERLTTFQIHVAKLHPTAEQLRETEARLTSAVERMETGIVRLTDRIDRWLDRDK